MCINQLYNFYYNSQPATPIFHHVFCQKTFWGAASGGHLGFFKRRQCSWRPRKTLRKTLTDRQAHWPRPQHLKNLQVSIYIYIYIYKSKGRDLLIDPCDFGCNSVTDGRKPFQLAGNLDLYVYFKLYELQKLGTNAAKMAALEPEALFENLKVAPPFRAGFLTFVEIEEPVSP